MAKCDKALALEGAQRHRGDGLDKEIADGGIDFSAKDVLARRVTEEPAAAEADVVGDELPAPRRTL